MGASVPIDLGALQFPFAGKELLRFMEAYDRVATMGVMVEDDSRGRVSRGPGGRPIVHYWLGRGERERLRRGVEILSRVFLAGGATDVITGVHGHRRIQGPADLARLRASLPAAGDFAMMAFHPVGTCRMARSEKGGVVSTDHEVFGVRDLFVTDGSVVPTAPAVNPQVTIMALATRAADRIASRLAAS
jgi:choline dehydrogenase-like flavoprotein